MLVIFISLFIFLSLIYFLYFRNSEIKEPYFDYDWSNSWSKYDKEARKNADCKPINKIHLKLGNVSTWIWTMPKSCEQGLPHTRGVDVIAIPINFPQDRLPPLLDHERVHLLQRMMPDSWAKFYKQKWDYTIYKEPPFGMPSDLIKYKRGNPDTSDAPYACWKSRYWSVPIYSAGLSLKDAQIKWWDQETGSVSDIAPDEWTVFFGKKTHQCEHPHELSAEFLSGPLRLGAKPQESAKGIKRLYDSWSKDALFPG